jgi:hypothetical protein
MKYFIFVTLCIASQICAMSNQDKHWLQERIDKCKQHDDKNRSDNLFESCGFMSSYVNRIYPTLCGGQGLRPEGLGGYWKSTHMDKSQKEVCAMITEALTDEKFVNNIID